MSGNDNGCWLQVRRLANLDPEQRRRLEAPDSAWFNVNLIRPLQGGALPLRRIFQSRDGYKVQQLDLWDYGYDARQRPWYSNAVHAGKTVVSSPYPSFSIGTPMITLSAPLRGNVSGVIAGDLKLDEFSEFVSAHRPGEHGMALLFDSDGVLLAHPAFARFADYALTHPSHPQLPTVYELKDPLVSHALQEWKTENKLDGRFRSESGLDFFFRLSEIPFGGRFQGYLLLLAAENDFIGELSRLQHEAVLIALLAAGCFVPAVWVFGGRISRSIRHVTDQAAKLWTLEEPGGTTVGSYVREIEELGSTMTTAQRAMWSFSRFVPKDLVKGVIDGSIATELGGERRELTILFTDVRDFTPIAEKADPDALIVQVSRYFTALTDAFLAEGGTVDKFIGDAVMVFWNAPKPQADHVDRACRAALAARNAADALNAQFQAEGAPRFVTRFGIHVGVAVVGNVGSTERMNYTVLGNSVNLAARLEELNKEYGTTILVSAAVRERLRDRFVLRPVASVTAKGMTEKTVIYELIDIAPAGALAVAHADTAAGNSPG